jgi:catechol 1,2-dioxygenase
MTTERTRTILEDLEQTVLQFMRKHKITHDEYRCATDILIATVKAGEGSLLYDVFFEAEATDIGNISRQGNVEAIEGPFYLPNAPVLKAPYVLPQRSDEAGDLLLFRGRVTSPDGHAAGRRRTGYVASGRRGPLLEHPSQHPGMEPARPLPFRF